MLPVFVKCILAKRFINLHRILPSDEIPVRTNHPGPKLVQHLKRSLIALEAKLALELEGGITTQTPGTKWQGVSHLGRSWASQGDRLT